MHKILWLLGVLLCASPAIYVYADGIYNNQAGGSGSTGISTITNNTTPTSGFVSGHIIGTSGGKTVDTGIAYAGLGTITAGSTTTSGFTSGNVIGVNSGVVVDTGVAYNSIGTIIAGTTIASGFTSGDILVATGGKIIDSGIAQSAVGTVTSISPGCGSTTSTGAITTAGTIGTQETIVSLTGANAPILASYCGESLQFSNAAAQAPTIAEAGTTGFPAGWFVDACNIGAGVQTITPASPGTIGGATTYVLPAGSATTPICARLISDGVSNYAIGFYSSTALSTIAIGTTTISGGTSGFCINNNAGVAGTVNCASNAPATTNVSGRWYLPAFQTNPGAGAAVTAGTVYCSFGGVTTPTTIKGLGAHVVTTVSGNGQFAVYSYSGGTLTYVNSTNSQANAASASDMTNTLTGGTTSVLSPGTLYAWCSNNSVAPTFSNATNGVSPYAGGTSIANIVTPMTGRNFTSAFGCTTGCTNGFPTTITFSSMTDVTTNAMPAVFYQVN